MKTATLVSERGAISHVLIREAECLSIVYDLDSIESTPATGTLVLRLSKGGGEMRVLDLSDGSIARMGRYFSQYLSQGSQTTDVQE